MYLHLYHGRKNPNEDLDDWGSDGGIFEIQCLVSTYNSHIRVETKESPEPFDLMFGEDCLYYDGVYYGDFAIYKNPIPNRRIRTLDPEKAIIPKK